MERIKKIDLAARLLRQSDCYKYKKGSNHTSRFNFNVDKDYPAIEMFNAQKGETLFMWAEEVYNITKAIGLSYYMQIYDGRLVCRIY